MIDCLRARLGGSYYYWLLRPLPTPSHLSTTQLQSSFFYWFTKPTDEGYDEIGDAIKDEIWPNPLQFYLGEDEGDEDDDEGGEDDVSIIVDVRTHTRWRRWRIWSWEEILFRPRALHRFPFLHFFLAFQEADEEGDEEEEDGEGAEEDEEEDEEEAEEDDD